MEAPGGRNKTFPANGEEVTASHADGLEGALVILIGLYRLLVILQVGKNGQNTLVWGKRKEVNQLTEWGNRIVFGITQVSAWLQSHGLPDSHSPPLDLTSCMVQSDNPGY